jgi:uncharacterized protein YeaO (DUF488 family)
MAQVQTKSLREAASTRDGRRILVMSLWPRGVKKSHVNEWRRELGTPLEIVRKWKKGQITWSQVRRAYLASLRDPSKQKSIAELAALARQGTITLLCSCPDESRCHRTLLKRVIEQILRRG